MGTLYVVATPIGNVEDLSPRACRILATVNVIAAEDTRHTGRLLARVGIETRMVSYHAFNEQSRIAMLLEHLESGDVALVSDAGTPAVSDPGSAIVRAALAEGFTVHAVPGPSSLTAAMSISGFSDGPAIFLGFLPRKQGERARLLERSFTTGFSVYFFESPRRVAATLIEIDAMLPGREIAVFRELTKLHEETLRGTAAQIAEQLWARETIKGEIVVGVAGGAGQVMSAHPVRDALVERLDMGMSVSQAAKEVAALTGRRRSEIYEVALKLREKSTGA
jgi:16S rRNA (cytidine1402-2'-O)-methyltransferase